MSPNAEACGCDYGLTPPHLCDVHRAKPLRSVYLAAPYDKRQDLLPLVTLLATEGIESTSRWIVDEGSATLSDAWARVDLADVARAEIFVALMWPEWRTLGGGGRHVEFGYALALGKPIILVGGRQNIFHYLDDVRYIDSPDDSLIQAIRSTPIAAPLPRPLDPEALIEQRVIGHGDGQRHAIDDVLALTRHLVAVPAPPFVRMEDVIRVADIVALVPR